MDACTKAMHKGTRHIEQKQSNESRPEVCLMPCSKLGAFAGGCVDVHGSQLDEQGEMF
jgi:hypothetical protein